ncbi:MAG: hypothetical protein KKA67_00450 [Spirochaetes bacterium]|nr:hypothetical protein [Spirochaetota bacterium]MBU1079978.1 hypothetical protein [Spirochaetota bacterium]
MRRQLAIIGLGLLLSGCGAPLLSLDVTVDGEITTGDEHNLDSNGYMFYYDLYRFQGTAGASFEVEIESREGDPVHFQINDLDLDLSSGSGTATAVFRTLESRAYSCDVYLRSDYVGSGSSYRLTLRRP